MSKVENIYHKINDEYSKLTIKSSNYQISTLINTCVVDKLKLFTWYRHSSTKYFASHPSRELGFELCQKHNIKLDTEVVLLHSLLLKLFNKEKPKKNSSVDHISRIQYDNRIENLRWASQSEQNQNRGKVARKKMAQELPDDLKNVSIPTYVTWNSHSEKTKVGKVLHRDFFRIEKHPALPLNEKGKAKIWSSTKSSKVNNIEKFNDTLKKLEELNNQIPEDRYESIRKENEESYEELMSSH